MLLRSQFQCCPSSFEDRQQDLPPEHIYQLELPPLPTSCQIVMKQAETFHLLVFLHLLQLQDAG